MLKTEPRFNFNTNFNAKNRVSFDLRNQVVRVSNILAETSPDMLKLNKASKSTVGQAVMEKLKNVAGVQKILDDGGLCLIIGNRLINIMSSKLGSLNLSERNFDTPRKEKSVSLNFDSVVESVGFGSQSTNLECYLNDIFETLDYPLFQLRRLLFCDETKAALRKISPKPVLNPNDIQTTEDIKSLFEEIKLAISSIRNISSRSRIKNEYPNVKPSNHGSKQLEFTGLGLDNNLDYSVNIISRGKEQDYLVIKISSVDKRKSQVIIIDPKHRALKEKFLGKVYNLGGEAVYYTQQELNSPLFSLNLDILKREMEKYNEYLKKRISEFNAFKLHNSTNEVGHIDKKTLILIENLMKQFDGCKSKMLKIKDAPRKDAFKRKYGVDTREGSPSLIFRHFNDMNETVHLSFPTMAGQRCMKIVVEKANGNIGKSFFVNGDKLVKFNATSLGRSKRTDVASNYFSQDEIENSGLQEYLFILKKRLSIIPKSE